MKNTHLYRIVIGYMLLFVVAILCSGIWLFLLSQGLSQAQILQTITAFIQTPAPKSVYGFVEVASPHLFAMGTLVFVVAHFMLFSNKISYSVSKNLAWLVSMSALFNIFAYGFISLGVVVSGWIKLFAMGVFVALFLILLAVVALSL